LEALEQVVAEHDTKRQALTLALEKARYEAQRAGRQYDLVDPGNRLVAGEREHRWNEALARVTEVEAQLATLQSQRSTLSEEQRQGLPPISAEQNSATIWDETAQFLPRKSDDVRRQG
jgi:hypothetical protein